MKQSSSRPQAIVITGAAGFIGSSIANRLLNHTGFHVIGVDNFHEYYARTLKEQNLEPLKISERFHFYEACFSNSDMWLKINRQFQVKTVIHLAAFAGVRPSLEDPIGYYENNVTKTIAMLDIMRDLEIKELLFTSSSSVYGGNKVLPFKEEHKVDQPISPYAATKKAGEEIIYTYCHLYQMKAMAFRLFTVYGPKQRPDLAIRKFMVSIENETPITLFGNGSSKRDYTYISDIVDAYVSAVTVIESFLPGRLEVMNLGSGRAINLLSMVHTIEQVLNKKAIIGFKEAHPADLEVTLADISKAQRILAYTPKVDFADGIDNLYQWLMGNEKARIAFRDLAGSTTSKVASNVNAWEKISKLARNFNF